jgi:phosphoribosyl 1,2-cyclic phosphodiesterase
LFADAFRDGIEAGAGASGENDAFHCFKFQVSSFKFQVSGFKFQVSGFRFQVEGLEAYRLKSLRFKV